MLTPSSRMSPLLGRNEAGDHAQRRGLAAAGWAEQHDHLAGLDLQVDLIDRDMVGEALGQAVEGEGRGLRHRATRPRRTKRSSSSRSTPTPTICATATAAISGSM